MKWLEALPKKERRGSCPRCVLLVDGGPDEVAQRLTDLVSFPGVSVSPGDAWMPRGKPLYRNGFWDDDLAKEVDLIKTNNLVSQGIQGALRSWWLAVARNARTPNWDIASTCEVEGRRGLLLVEAKAHENELSYSGKSPPGASPNSQRNHQQIGQTIAEANTRLELLTENAWGISRDTHYQLSNRFAWAWKLASLGVPVVLVYLGFLNAAEMVPKPLFHSHVD